MMIASSHYFRRTKGPMIIKINCMYVTQSLYLEISNSKCCLVFSLNVECF
uniref:Uncharacterized protein n=1 Tax=Anguilla anguilla TaxID=7936 RepID=A0A0E9VK59_ANGAN